MIEIKHNYKDGLLSHLQYLYDAVGNIRQKTEESSESDRTSIFHYDSLYRLRDVSNMEVNSINNLESLYPADNPISESIPDLQAEINNFIRADIPRSREYTYDATGNRVTYKGRKSVLGRLYLKRLGSVFFHQFKNNEI